MLRSRFPSYAGLLAVLGEERDMEKKNRFERLFPDVSAWGFGSWALGGEYWGRQEHQNSVRVIHRALALGLNHFDTAPVYGKGRSEQILGQQLRKIRSSCILGTKAFYSSPEQMLKSFETSLKRLLCDYVDIFYIHWPLRAVDMRPGMEMLESLRRQGRIRALGVSNFNLEQLRMVEEAGQVDVYQGGYKLLWPLLEDEILPELRLREIAFIPYGVLGQGLLTEKGPENLFRQHEGFRHKMILYHEDYRPFLSPLLETFLCDCKEFDIFPEEAAARYVLEKTGASSVLLGCRNRNQAERNFAAAPEPLPEELKARMEQIRIKAGKMLPKVPNLFNHVT